MTIEQQNLTNLTRPRHYRQPVPEESRPALRALGFTDAQLDSQECIEAIWKTHGPDAAYWFFAGSGIKYLRRAGQKVTAPTPPWQWLLWHFWPGYKQKMRTQAVERDQAKAMEVFARVLVMDKFDMKSYDIDEEIHLAMELIP